MAEAGRCGAVTRSGSPCRRKVVTGRCRHHGTEDTGRPPAPDGLSSEADALWRSMVEEFDMDDHELAVLREAVRTLTACDQLAKVLDAEGVASTGSKGQRVVHPAVSELRMQRLAFVRLIAQLRLPEEPQQDETAGRRPPQIGAARGMYAIGGGRR